MQIELRAAVRVYLDDLAATGAFGDTAETVALTLIERGVQDALTAQIISARQPAADKTAASAEPIPAAADDEAREDQQTIEAAPHSDGRTEAQRARDEKSRKRLNALNSEQATANNLAVLDAIWKTGPQTSTAEIAARTGLAAETARRVVKRLVASGALRAEGWARGRRYYIVGAHAAEVTDPEAENPGKPKGRPGRPRADKPRRRFDGRKDLEPEKVHGLPGDHAALTEGRSLFPTTVIRATETPRVFVSGQNQRKLGDRVSKGPWKGMPIYALTLEERATCPTTCHHWNTCFGNGMPLARRHAHGFELESRIELEVDDLARSHSQGFVIRLHVLGDFYSADYVELWGRLLQYHPALHVFGYTAWTPDTEIGAAIARLRRSEPDRFAIRNSLPDVSAPQERHMAATTIWRVAQGRQAEGIVCPAQTHPSVCCGSCGLCWHPDMRGTPIAFIAHGRKSEAPTTQDGIVSSVAPAPVPATTPTPKQDPMKGRPPEESLRRPPHVATRDVRKPAAAKREAEQSQIDAWLEKNGGSGRRFQAGTLLSQLQGAFESAGLRIEYSPSQKFLKTPYIVETKSGSKTRMSTADAIKRADTIRAEHGLEPIEPPSEGVAA
ncbi:MAG: GP88 family protein [Thalassobaculum sp.]